MKIANIKSILSLVAMFGIFTLMPDSTCSAETRTFTLKEPFVSITANKDEAYLINKTSEVFKVSASGELSKINVKLDLDRTEPDYSQARDLTILNNNLIFVVGNSNALQFANLKNPGRQAESLQIPGLAIHDRPIRVQRCGDNLLIESLNGTKKLFKFNGKKLSEITALEGILAGSSGDEPFRIEVSGSPEKLATWKVFKAKSNETVFTIAATSKAKNILDLQVLGQDKNHNLYCLLTQGPAEQNTTARLITVKNGKEINREKFAPLTIQAMTKSNAVSATGIIFAVRKNSADNSNNWGNLHVRTP